MEDKTYYGVLMQKVLIDNDIYLFKPQSLLEGVYLVDEDNNRSFMDTLNYEYNLIEDIDSTYDCDVSIGYIIEESDLLSKYPNMDIHKAKSNYFESILENVHFGFYNYNTNKLNIVTGDLRQVLSKVNSEEEVDELQFDSELESQPDLKEGIYFDIETFQKMALETDACEVKKTLKHIYEEYTNLSKNDISKILEGILSQKEEEVKLCLNKLEEKVTVDLCALDELKEQNLQVREYEEFLYHVIDVVDTTKERNDLRNHFEEVKNSFIQNFQTIEREIEKHSINIQESSTQEKNNHEIKKVNVAEMKRFFDERIFGLEEAKKSIITAIAVNKLAPGRKSNSSLIIGPTGSGKTYLCQVASEYLNLPCEIVDTTQLTVAGYVGANIEENLTNLLRKANGNQEVAEQGIIVLNEIDKKGSESNSDVAGRGVLNSLLPFIEGTTYRVNYNNRYYNFNTSRLTIFATGAFTAVSEKKKKSNIGFHKEIDNKYEKIENPITIEDLAWEGGMPMEFLGRMTSIIELPSPTEESLIAILGVKNSELEIEREVLAKMGMELEEDREYRRAVAKKALKLKTGARSLKTIIEESIKQARWIALTNPGEYVKIILTPEAVEDNALCLLKNRYGDFLTVNEVQEKKGVVRKRYL